MQKLLGVPKARLAHMFAYTADQSLFIRITSSYSSVNDQLDAFIVNYTSMTSALPAKVLGLEYCKFTSYAEQDGIVDAANKQEIN